MLQLLSGFLTQGHLPRVSRQSCLSANDKGGNGMIPGAVLRATGIYLTAEENPRKLQLGDKGALRPVIASNGVPFLQMRSAGSHSTSGMAKEGKKERIG